MESWRPHPDPNPNPDSGPNPDYYDYNQPIWLTEPSVGSVPRFQRVERRAERRAELWAELWAERTLSIEMVVSEHRCGLQEAMSL